MNYVFQNLAGNKLEITDYGLTVIKDTGDVFFFPYGSLTNIKVGFLGVDIIGDGKTTFFLPQTGAEKKQIKALVPQLMEMNRTAAPAKSVVRPGESAAARFYQSCKDSGLALTEQSAPDEREKGKALAAQAGLKTASYAELLDAYQKGKGEVRLAKRRKKYEELYKQGQALHKYLPYEGREKRYHMALDMAEYYKRYEEQLISGGSANLMKEKDWAVMGGIASAIAGGFAGLAVAADIQAQNAQIRQHNDRARSAYARGILPEYTKVREEQARWKRIAERNSKARMTAHTAEELFRLLQFSNAKAVPVSSGGVVVTVDVLAPHVWDHGGYHSIDGTFIARILQNGEVVSEVPMVIPYKSDPSKTWGNRIEYSLLSSAPGRADPNAHCDVEFACGKLWAIE